MTLDEQFPLSEHRREVSRWRVLAALTEKEDRERYRLEEWGRKAPPQVRFARCIEVDVATGCWLWTGCTTRNGGYGQFWDGQRRVVAHRWAYEEHVGPIPAEFQVDHLCRVCRCVNPAHLEAVTAAENNRRSDSPAGVNGRKTHCKRGHEFTPDNTYLDRGKRGCWTCLRARLSELRKPTHTRPCDWCGETFTTFRSLKRYCSVLCQQTHRNARRPSRAR